MDSPKRCPTCQLVKPITDFHLENIRQQTRAGRCRKFHAEYQRGVRLLKPFLVRAADTRVVIKEQLVKIENLRRSMAMLDSPPRGAEVFLPPQLQKPHEKLAQAKARLTELQERLREYEQMKADHVRGNGVVIGHTIWVDEESRSETTDEAPTATSPVPSDLQNSTAETATA